MLIILHRADQQATAGDTKAQTGIIMINADQEWVNDRQEIAIEIYENIKNIQNHENKILWNHLFSLGQVFVDSEITKYL